ncbi:MAG: PmoA family protein, partial [Verrucomicrobia bacterium]|nr:PmoA family protein [Verrucomicrobiota bacterium]
MPQSVEFGRTDFRHPAPWSRPSAALRWGVVVVLGCLGILVQTAGAATAPSEVSGYPVRLECGEGSVTFKLRSKAVVTYHGGHGVLPAGVPEEYRRAGYLHPLVSPLGRVVTGDYSKNHLHHHGVWASWTRTEIDGRKPDFWNMGEKKGRVEMIQWLGSR